MQCLITQFAGRAQAGHFFQRLVNFCREEIYFSHDAGAERSITFALEMALLQTIRLPAATLHNRGSA